MPGHPRSSWLIEEDVEAYALPGDGGAPTLMMMSNAGRAAVAGEIRLRNAA
jgi:hypothetical protein